MEQLSKNCKVVRFDEKLLKWSLENNRLRCEAEYENLGPKHIPCGNDCGKAITIGDEIVVAHNKKGHIRGIFCSVLCQRQYIITVMAQEKRRKDQS